MAGSKKPPSDEGREEVVAAVARALDAAALKDCRIVAALSGGVDSVVLLHVLHRLRGARGLDVRALHVNHGLSANARAWALFCRRYCRSLEVPLRVRRVKVAREDRGVEAAAREARYAVFRSEAADVIALAHHLDDQAETVLLNLLRGTGARGASGMPERSALGAKVLVRPLLAISRIAIERYARIHGLDWVEDESNADEAMTRNFLRHRVGPLLAQRFPRWKENLARAARHFAAQELDAHRLLREFLRGKGLRAPSESKLQELLRQLVSEGARTAVRHDGRILRTYRGEVFVAPEANEPHSSPHRLLPVPWKGERKVLLPTMTGEVRFLTAARVGEGLDPERVLSGDWRFQGRRGGERLQPDARRPRRTLKNLFQEAGVPPWERDAMPLLFCGEDLVWAPGLGIDCRYLASGRRGLVPQWRRPRAARPARS